MAVTIIFWGLQVSEHQNKIQQTIFIQFLLSLALMPLVAWHYYEVPVFSLLANLIAVPFVSLIGLPLLLIASLVGMISIDAAREFIKLSDEFWGVLWDYLYWLTSLPLNQFSMPSFSFLWLVLFYLGIMP